MLLTNVRNMEDIGEAIDRCNGDVYLRLDDRTERNLKEDRFLLNAIKTMKIGENGLDIRFQDRNDLMIFMNEVYGTYQI